MNVHRRKQSSSGTGCADPSNSKSVSFTERASISSSIVREHDFLGAYPKHTEVVDVHRQEDTWKIYKNTDIICIIHIIRICLI